MLVLRGKILSSLVSPRLSRTSALPNENAGWLTSVVGLLFTRALSTETIEPSRPDPSEFPTITIRDTVTTGRDRTAAAEKLDFTYGHYMDTKAEIQQKST